MLGVSDVAGVAEEQWARETGRKRTQKGYWRSQVRKALWSAWIICEG